jgi:hypothetical protein
MILYTHKEIKGYLKLVKIGSKGLNVFDHVNEFGSPTYKKRPWSNGPELQTFIIRGWDKLTHFKGKNF